LLPMRGKSGVRIFSQLRYPTRPFLADLMTRSYLFRCLSQSTQAASPMMCLPTGLSAMKTPRVHDFDPNAKLPELGSPLDHLPAIQKPASKPVPSPITLPTTDQQEKPYRT